MIRTKVLLNIEVKEHEVEQMIYPRVQVEQCLVSPPEAPACQGRPERLAYRSGRSARD